MGETMPAAKYTHVPTKWMSEQPDRLSSMRQPAIDGHREIARRTKGLVSDYFPSSGTGQVDVIFPVLS